MSARRTALDAANVAKRASGAKILAAVALCAIAALVSAADAGADTPAQPQITTQPVIGIVDLVGGQTSFEAAAAGSPAPTVQWQVSSDRRGPWVDLPGATGTSLFVTASNAGASAFALGNAYRAVFTNASGTAISRPAKLISRIHWMRDLGDDIGNVPLNELTIPGSHDTGSYAINEDSGHSLDGQSYPHCFYLTQAICARYGRAQTPTIDAYGELEDGIRHFDLRTCGNETDVLNIGPPSWPAYSTSIRTCHGLDGAPLQDILEQTRAFVDSHPGELVILDFNHHYQLVPDLEAAQIEAAMALPGGGSLLIPPQYCTVGNPSSGICAGTLTLNSIAQRQLGRVIVNYVNEGAPGALQQSPVLGPIVGAFYIQPELDAGFYDRHPLFWGRSSSFPSAFGNDPETSVILPRVLNSLIDRGDFDPRHFFVQFLQTTPTTGYILGHLGGSLLEMALQSNPVVGPAVFACGPGDACFAQYRPENLNVLSLNFYERTHYLAPDALRFDFVEEVIRFNEYARTAPVVEISTSTGPAASGWRNAAVLGQGNPLRVEVSATDYFYSTGVTALDCQDNFRAISFAAGVPTTASRASGSVLLGDGMHAIDCRATDGADRGVHAYGNRGAGPGSTPTPATFRVDTTPPAIRCETTSLILNQPSGTVTAAVSDATSGPTTPTASAPVATDVVGSFTVELTASDAAGNTSAAVCPYTVSYRISLRYDKTRQSNSGATIRIAVGLSDYFGANVPSTSVTLVAKVVTNTGTGATQAPTSPGSTHPDFAFNLSQGGNYQYNLQTTGYPSGAYALGFLAGADPMQHEAPFVIG